MNQHSALPESGFLTPHSVKQRYSICNSTMYAWIARNYLPAPVKVGPRAVRFRVEDIRDFEAKFLARDEASLADGRQVSARDGV